MPEETIYPVSDAFIDEQEANQKAGTWNYLLIDPYPGYRQRSLLFFDVSSFLPGTTINSAKLYLYYYLRASSEGIGRTHGLHRILQDWAESTVNWNTRPTHDSEISASKVIPSGYGWLDWDIKSDLEKFIAGTYTNKGWLLIDETTEAVEAAGVAYRSREFATHKPYLLVDYTPPPPIQRSLSDQMAIQGAVTDTWKYAGLAKRISESLSILDHPVFRLNDKILVFLQDQVQIFDGTLTKTFGEATTEFPPSDDSWLDQNDPDTIHGSETYLELIEAPDIAGHPVLRFDISEISAGATISEALLYLYYYQWANHDPVGLIYDAHRITSTWVEETVTWNTKPSHDATRTSYITMPASYGWINWDVKDDVQDFVDGVETDYGWLLKAFDEEPEEPFVPRFYSKENATLKPYLKVTYTAPTVYRKSIKDQLLINDILTRADMEGYFYRGLGDNLTPISDSLSYRRIPRSLLTDLDLSPAQIVRREFPVSEIIPEDEVLVVFIETADGQKWKHKLQPL